MLKICLLESCRKQFETFLKKQKYCSYTCSGASRRKSIDDVKKDGYKKIKLLEKRGHKCEVCSLEVWMGKEIPLELDHIDGHPGHGNEDNLRLICPNCHAQTDTHAGKNVGKHFGTDRQIKYSKGYPDYRKRLKDIY